MTTSPKNLTDDKTTRRVALLAAVMGSFLTPFMSSAVMVALPSIERELGMDAITLNWVGTSFLLAAAVCLVPFGRIADIVGRKKVFSYGIGIFTVASLLAAVAPSAWLLIVFRVLQGMGTAMVTSNAIAIPTSVFPPSERGKVLGIVTGTVYVGLTVGSAVGGLLTDHFGWRSIFLVGVPLGLVTIAGVLWKLKGDWKEARGESFDLIGSVIWGCVLIALMYGFSLLPAPTGLALVVLGLAGVLVFIKWESKVSSPVLDVGLLKANVAFSFSNLAALLNYSSTFGMVFLLSLYLQYIKGLSAEATGLLFVIQTVVMAVVAPISGRLSDRVEPRIIASTGMALSAVGLVMLVFLSQNTGVVYILISLIILGFGFGFFSSPNANAIMSSVDRRFYGVASGTMGAMRLVGQMLSMGIVMMVFSLHIGRAQITPQNYGAFLDSNRTAFIIFSILCLGGIYASLARGKVQRQAEAGQGTPRDVRLAEDPPTRTER